MASNKSMLSSDEITNILKEKQKILNMIQKIGLLS